MNYLMDFINIKLMWGVRHSHATLQSQSLDFKDKREAVMRASALTILKCSNVVKKHCQFFFKL